MFKLMQMGGLLSSMAMQVSQFFVNSVSLSTTGTVKDEELLETEAITSFAEFANGLTMVMESIVGPIMIALGAVLAVYMVYLGVMYAKAEDANKRKELMGRLIGCAIGIVIIIVGITLCYAINWVDLYANMTGHRHTFEASEKYSEYCKYCGQKSDTTVHKVVEKVVTGD
ncbi:MAG: hypothetical protein IJW59_04065 [Clostridia bacterium]|nr:hypothetical protein [Clostridia bacterium]